MTNDGPWERDPARDPVLERALQAVAAAPLGDTDARRMEAGIMSAVHREVAAGVTSAWWEVAARWAPAAAAAGIVAVLLSGAILLGSAPAGRAYDDGTAPETAALAQVIDRYPGDAVLASLISGDQPDALSSWGEP
jgi:hypothetical protein